MKLRLNTASIFKKLFIVGFLFVFFDFAWGKWVQEKNHFDFKKAWKQIDSLQSKGLYQEAFQRTDAILVAANQEKNEPQFAKAIITKINLLSSFSENPIQESLNLIEENINSNIEIRKGLLLSFRANCFQQYYRQNRYRFYSKENVVSNSENINEWSEDKMKKVILTDFLHSLNYKKQYDFYTLFDFEPALNAAREGRLYKPTLYDLMVWSVLDYTQSQPDNIEKAAYDNWDLEIQSTSTEVLDSSNTWSVSNFLFKQLIAYHNLRPEAKLFNQLQYLKFVYTNSSDENKDSLYEVSINRLMNENARTPLMVMAANDFAEHLIYNAGKYNAENLHYRWNYVRAKQLLEKTIAKYPDAPQINLSKNMLLQISTPIQQLYLENYTLPHQPILVKLKTRNCDKLYYRVLKLSKAEYEELKSNYLHQDKIQASLLNRKPVNQNHLNYNLTNDFREHSFEFVMDGLAEGFYAVVSSNSSNFKVKEDLMNCYFINVSNLSYLVQSKAEDRFDVIVRSRKDGSSVKNVKVSLYYNEYDYKARKNKEVLFKTLNSDENGELSFIKNNQDNISKIVIEKDQDILISNEYFYNYYSEEDNTGQIISNIYTDRAIYRPGQIVYFKGIVYKIEKKDKSVIPNKDIEVDLTDVNGQNVSSLKMKTNQFGSYSGQFVLPLNGLNGYYTITDDFGSLGINVEEYKRPKFSTYFNSTNQSYKLNSPANLYGTAKAFSGAPIAGAKVKYTVYKSPVVYYNWRYDYNPHQSEKIFATGEVLTNDTGGYLISFLPLPDKKKSFSGNYQFRIEARVMDLSGESHSASKSIYLGEREYNFAFISSDVNDINTYGMLELNDTSRFMVKLSSSDGQIVDRDIKIRIEEVQQPDKPLYKRLWESGDTSLYNVTKQLPFYGNAEDENPDKWKTIQLIEERVVKSNQFVLQPQLVNKSLLPGSYHIKAQVLNSNGKQEESDFYFVVKQAGQLSSDLNWFVTRLNKNSYEPGEIALINIYSYSKEAKIFYSVEQINADNGKSTITNSFILTSNHKARIELPVEYKHRGGFFVTLSYQENNRTYTNRINIEVPYTDKELVVSTESIRDNLLPGSKEKWNIKISGAKKEKVLSEFLCAMYDASLDEFQINFWQTNFFSPNSSLYIMVEGAVPDETRAQFLSYPEYKYHSYSPPIFDQFIFNNNSTYYYSQLNFDREGDNRIHDVQAVAAAPALMGNKLMEVSESKNNVKFSPLGIVDASVLSGETKKVMGGASQNEATQFVPRTIFNETAFFYPQLSANENGEVVFSFTMPESVTKWKFMGMAHTNDLKAGNLERFITTSKPLMCTPNYPRTFRQGDEIIIKSRIDNITDKPQNVKCKINIEDELTNRSINHLVKDEMEKTVMVNAKSSSLVSWRLTIKDASDLIKITTTAVGNDYTDGEVVYIPVLSNKQMVIESMPFLVDSTFGEFYFESLAKNNSATRVDKSFSIEFTSNPIWSAIQSLPYLMEYPHECSEQLFSRFFANQLAHHIIKSHPEIERMFNKWKIKSPEAFISCLQKNPELKQILINETPWVLESNDESVQRSNMAMLFDLNKMNNELSTIQSKLINAQALNGGWPWFKGMADDEYITTHVIEGLLELQKLGALNLNDNSELSESINKGISYLATRQKEAYQNILKNKNAYKEYIPSRNELIRLLIFSRTADYRSHLKKEDSQYFLSQASKYWLKLSLDEKVILAKVLHSTDSNKFTEIVNSFKDNAIKNSKIGWYWKENLRSGYYVNSDIELHAEMLELFSSYQRDDKMIKQLSKWLLLNKHSNKWDNTKASTKAIYSLLMSSNDLNAGVKATIRMGSKKILVDEQNAESGSGYYKESIALAVIKPDMAKVRIEKANNSVAYGAVYWKYLEEMDKLEPKGGFLKINKTYFIKAINKGVQEYVPVTNSVIKTGDEILVRVFITNDRDMEYVYLKDMRPSGLEPVDVVSKSQYQKGIWYYQSTRDAATDFFLHFLPKGEHELTYKLKVNNAGSFESGVSSIQCMYAPEFSGNSKSTKIKVVE